MASFVSFFILIVHSFFYSSTCLFRYLLLFFFSSLYSFKKKLKNKRKMDVQSDTTPVMDDENLALLNSDNEIQVTVRARCM